jgi:hypothetical protein
MMIAMMNDTEQYLPSREDLHKMVKVFCSVHYDNVLDGVGPNKPDASFFEGVANNPHMSFSMYVEIARRFEKYTKTQLPLIAHIAGYSKDEDWESALSAIREQGEAYEEILAEGGAWMHDNAKLEDYPSFNNSTVEQWVQYLISIGYLPEDANEEAHGWITQLSSMYNSKSVKVEEYDEVWFSKNDPARRYPKKTTRVALDWGRRDTDLYQALKTALPFPTFKYDGSRMSVAKDRNAVLKACDIIYDHGYIVDAVREYASTLSERVVQKSTGFGITLVGDGIMLRIPHNDLDTRYKVKNLSTRKWMADEKAWRIPLSEASRLIQSLGEEHALSKLMNQHTDIKTYLLKKAERIAISGASELSNDAVIAEMKERLKGRFPEGKELFPFQYVGVRFGELAGGRFLLGDDMGVGKTIQALAYAALHEEQWPVIVICPANVKYNWAKEIASWLPTSSLQVVEGRKFEFNDSDFTVINYDLVSYCEEQLLDMDANIVIFDESHYVKNKGSKKKPVKRTVACMNIAEDADSVVCLSGTPITNRPVELFTTLEMVRPSEYKGQYWPYVKRYCNAYNNGYAWDVKGASNIPELHEKLRDVMIRRLKEEVLPELPDKMRQFIPAKVSTADLADYRQVHRSLTRQYSSMQSSGSVPPGFVLQMLTSLRHAAGRLKVTPTIEWIKEYKSQKPDTPLVVFYHHKDVGASLLEAMGDEKTLNAKKWRVISGETPAQSRAKYVEQFQMGMLDGLLCSTGAAKEGITLTAADTVVFVEREWTPGYEEQAEDRIRRIGAEGKDVVWATYISAVGTIDEHFDRVIETKREVIQGVLDGKQNEVERANIANEILKSMIDAGDLPESMMALVDGSAYSKPKNVIEEEE